MKMRFAAVICSTLTGLMILSSQAVAQQKTIRDCQEEWHQQSCQSSERHHRKVLRGAMSGRWRSLSADCRSGTINYSSSKSWSKHSSI